jgi:DDE superfamily endonuclease
VDHQPRPGVSAKTRRRDRLIQWAAQHPDGVLGFADAVWWSRRAQPALHAWAEDDHPLRLVEQTVAKDDPDPKALACYGGLLRQRGQEEHLWLRFVEGRPVSAVTLPFLEWCCSQLEAQGVRVWGLIWDNASWHISKAVRAWVRAHNHQVKRRGHGVRLLVCCLPVKSPWLNPIEPKWVHGKRAIVEPTRLLTAQEVAERVCASFDCSHEEHLIQEKVS